MNLKTIFPAAILTSAIALSACSSYTGSKASNPAAPQQASAPKSAAQPKEEGAAKAAAPQSIDFSYLKNPDLQFYSAVTGWKLDEIPQSERVNYVNGFIAAATTGLEDFRKKIIEASGPTCGGKRAVTALLEVTAEQEVDDKLVIRESYALAKQISCDGKNPEMVAIIMEVVTGDIVDKEKKQAKLSDQNVVAWRDYKDGGDYLKWSSSDWAEVVKFGKQPIQIDSPSKESEAELTANSSNLVAILMRMDAKDITIQNLKYGDLAFKFSSMPEYRAVNSLDEVFESRLIHVPGLYSFE